MNYMRLSSGLAAAGLAALLSGCVVAPIGPPRPYAVYPSGPVYVDPAPVVVVPGPYYYGYRGGYWGYRGGYGYGHGFRGRGYRR